MDPGQVLGNHSQPGKHESQDGFIPFLEGAIAYGPPVPVHCVIVLFILVEKCILRTFLTFPLSKTCFGTSLQV